MKSILLFLCCSHYLVSTSNSSASSTVDDALLVPFKKILTEAWEYNYDKAKGDIVYPENTQSQDSIVTLSQRIIEEFSVRTQYKNIWGQLLAGLALTNNHFDGILSNNLSVKSLRILEYILNVFNIPNDLHETKTTKKNEAERVTWECLRRLYRDYLGEVLPTNPTNMHGIIVFLYIHTMQGKINLPSRSLNSSIYMQLVYNDDYEQYSPYSDSNSSTKRKPIIQFHNVKFETPVQSLKNSNALPLDTPIVSNNNAIPSASRAHEEKEKQGVVVIKSTMPMDKRESKTAVDEVKQASNSKVEEEYTSTTDEGKGYIIDMLEKNSNRLIFEDQEDRYKDIDILRDAKNT